MSVGRITALQLVRDSARPLRIRRLLQALPTELVLAEQEASRLGLRPVSRRKVLLEASEMALAQVLAVDDRQGFLCSIVCGFLDDAPSALWECATLLDGSVGGDRGSEAAGLLLTTSRHAMPRARGEIIQTLVDAPPHVLVAAHREARSGLEARGIRALEVTDPGATAAAVHSLLGQPGRDDRRGTVRVFRSNLRLGRHEGVGRLIDQPELDVWIAELRDGHVM